jgi:hypothetical protein
MSAAFTLYVIEFMELIISNPFLAEIGSGRKLKELEHGRSPALRLNKTKVLWEGPVFLLTHRFLSRISQVG